MRQVSIKNTTRPLAAPLLADYAESFGAKLRGLMLRRELDYEGGLLLAEATQSTVNAGIHMLFMNFDISVAWLDSELRVVDAQHARRWAAFLLPRKPARYVLEFHASRLEEFRVGDQIAFEDHPAA
jgi:uncharacterized membrane protein (UPF0127 family)